VEAVIELAGDAEGGGVGGTGGSANFNEPGGSLKGNAKNEARRTAHENVGRLIVDGNRGQAEAVWAERDSDQLDFAIGQRGGRENLVDARQLADGRSGLRGGTSHINARREAR
jgi:hypothetical protein